MRRQQTSVSFIVRALPFVALALAVLPAAWPYLEAGVPRTNDLPHHLYRTVALDGLVRAGHVWPRWSPDLVHGYGYPVYNFFPSLSHLLVESFHLAGLPLTTAYRAAVVTHAVLAAWFAYLLGRDLAGPLGGWIAALAYVYSPYVLYDAHVRGSLPESQALALLPLLILAIRKCSTHGGRWLALCAATFATTYLSHPGITFQLLIPLGLLLLWLGKHAGWRNLWKPVAALGLGVLLITFYWLPALAEVQYVQSDVAIARGYSYTKYLLTLRDMLAWPRLPADPALVNPPVVRALPQAALALVTIGLAWRWRKLDRSTRQRVGQWGLILIACVWLATPLSRGVWDNVPLLQLTFTPFRLLGMASLAIAMLLAASFAEVAIRARTLALTAALALVLLIAAVPWLYPPREPVPEAPTLADVTRFEVLPTLIGTTNLGEFLPVWVQELPDTRELRRQLTAGESPDRLAPAEGVAVEARSGSPLDATYVIQAEQAAKLTYRQFYFPGWQASLDGAPLPVRPSEPHGLIEFAIPAGKHTLDVHFGSTPARTAGWVVSGLAALGLAAITFFPIGLTPIAPGATGTLPLRWLPLLAGLMIAGKLCFDGIQTPLHRPTLGAEGLTNTPGAPALDFGELQLLAHEQSATRVAGDEEVELTTYWRPLHPIGVAYDAVVNVVSAAGGDLAWDTGGLVRPSDYRFAPGTDGWPVDGYVMDARLLRLRDGTPPGEYAFRISLVRRDTGQTVASERIGHLAVDRPFSGNRPLEGGLVEMPEAQPWDGVRLLGVRTDRHQAAPGDPARVTLLWQVVEPNAIITDQCTLSLATADGEAVFTTLVPIAPQYPLERWQAGDRLRTEAVLRLPARTPEGELAWLVRVGESDGLKIDTLQVNAPDRLWTEPSLDVQTGTRLGEVATLLGANVAPSITVEPGASLTVTLAWQPERETTTSYRVFLHLIAPTGEIAAQSDGEPADWTRPTTGWLPGEVVLDERTLQIPADAAVGAYTLSCGLYDAATGQRLTSPAGNDAVRLATITVQDP